MRVLKPSPIIHDWKMVINCTWCQAELEIEAGDLRVTPATQFEEREISITCCECKRPNDIPADQVPVVILEDIQRKRRLPSR